MSKIIGNTTTTPVPRSDWEQVDKTKADFIRHKPTLGTIAEKDVGDYYTKSETDEKLDEVVEDIIAEVTPVKGVDYWTVDDKQSIVAEVQAGATQIEPLYAESAEWLEENGDTSKVYILPDGFIYAFLMSEGESYNNIVPRLEAYGSKSPYNGVGYKNGTYISTAIGTSGDEYVGVDTTTVSTGYIPYAPTDKIAPVLYVSGVDLMLNTHCRVGLCSADKTVVATIDIPSDTTYFNYTKIADNYWKIEAKTATDGGLAIKDRIWDIVYIRISAGDSGKNMIITIDEPITKTSYTNWLPISTDENGNVFNGTGYQTGLRFNSSGSTSEYANTAITGFIPAKLGDIIDLSAGLWKNSGDTYYYQFKVYDSEKNPLCDGYMSVDSMMTSASTYGMPYEVDANGNIISFTLESTNSTWKGYLANTAYIRLAVISSAVATGIITVNEEQVESGGGTEKTWKSTGHAFVPADYEDRILTAERNIATNTANINDLKERTTILENLDLSGIPDYTKEEAERVGDIVHTKRTAQSLVFVALSDTHISVGNDTKQAVIDTGNGIAEIRKNVPIDFVGLFGDYVAGGSTSMLDGSKSELKFVHKAMYEATNGVQQIWLQGNHDRNPYDTDDGDLTTDELYSYIFAHNTGCTVDSDNVERGYGFKDFEAQKIRVVYLNTSDNAGYDTSLDIRISKAQFEWLIGTALNFDDKSNPTDWGVIVLSHIPFNWGGFMTNALNIVDGYISGRNGSVTTSDGDTLTFNFANKERAEIICLINGHTHNFRYSQIGENNIYQIAVPQVCAGRYNEYGTSWPAVGGELNADGNPVYWNKTAGTSESTSFCVFVIDRKNRIVNAICYGAGIDREISY